MERENQRIMLTKRLLKESMMRLLARKELEKISVTELCRDAGINRATFYRHYEIPRDVLSQIAVDSFYEMRNAVGMLQSQADIKPAIERLCAFMEKNMDLMRLIIKNSTESDFTTFVNTLYAEIWSELRKVSFLSELSDETIQLLILYSAGGCYFVLRHWLLGNIHRSSREMADYLYQLLSGADLSGMCDRLGILPK